MASVPWSAPSYAGLLLDQYVSLLNVPNPMQRLWSDGRWNKLTIAHGCYWGKCTFCDVSLDYVNKYEPASADTIIDRMIHLMNETGESGFHFVDEAAPPAGLRSLSQRILERGVVASRWTNVRFEKTFDRELALLMARAGCIGVTGGLEVASDRLLKFINKGVTVRQVANVTRAFTGVGIGVHAYLMYAIPSQTEQEVIDSLEIVRQLFEHRCIDPASWHQFFATAHSPVGVRPELFGVRLRSPLATQPLSLQRHRVDFIMPLGGETTRVVMEPRAPTPGTSRVFLQYGLPIENPNQAGDMNKFSRGLRVAVFHYMHGLELQRPSRTGSTGMRRNRPSAPRWWPSISHQRASRWRSSGTHATPALNLAAGRDAMLARSATSTSGGATRRGGRVQARRRPASAARLRSRAWLRRRRIPPSLCDRPDPRATSRGSR